MPLSRLQIGSVRSPARRSDGTFVHHMTLNFPPQGVSTTDIVGRLLLVTRQQHQTNTDQVAHDVTATVGSGCTSYRFVAFL